jgi:hypothetical protein
MAVAILIIHHRPTLIQLQFDESMPVGSADFVKVAGGTIRQAFV